MAEFAEIVVNKTAMIAKFADPPSYCYGATGELANDVQSNFVSIASSPLN